MWQHDIGSVPVVDDDGKLVGFLTDRDACMGAYTQGKRLSDIAISTVISRKPITCKPTDSLHEIQRLMSKNQIRRLPVTDKSGNATDGYSWTFGAVDQASWTALGFAGVQSASTIAIVYDDSVKDDAPNWIDEDHPGGVAASLATVNGVRLWEVGFGGIQAGEYWEAVGPSDFLLDYADGPGSDGVSQDELKFGANLNITHDYLTSGVTLLLHDYLERSRGLHTWQIEGNGEALDPGNFQLGTDTNLYIVATPEPASLALLGLGLAAFGGVLYRRRRKV
jgi:CBS domain-containing protein